MLLFLHHLDDMTAQGCQTPDCTHDDHKDELSMHQRCHTGTGVQVAALDLEDAQDCAAMLRVCCQVCSAEVVRIAVDTIPDLRPKCPHLGRRGLDVVYCHGQVHVTCRACHAPYATMDVAVHGPGL